jgi:hypothetical protein
MSRSPRANRFKGAIESGSQQKQLSFVIYQLSFGGFNPVGLRILQHLNQAKNLLRPDEK